MGTLHRLWNLPANCHPDLHNYGRGLCRNCYSKWQYHHTNAREAQRDRLLKKKYGITREEFDKMLSAQGERCAICARALKIGKDTHVDHSHVSLQIRGILCSPCNTGLGQFQDDPALLASAIEYLRAHS